MYKEFSQNFEAYHMTVLMLQMGLTLNRIILELLSHLFYLLMFTFSLAPIIGKSSIYSICASVQ